MLLLVALSTGLRWELAAASGHFDADPIGSVRSDPGLLYYLSERVASQGADAMGLDMHIEHPDGVHIARNYALGQEGLLAFARRWVEPGFPLHLLALRIMALVASLSIVSMYGLGRELTGSQRWGLMAAVIYTFLPAAYRSIGFVFVREDLSLPFFALHLWMAARAFRLRTLASGFLAGLSLAAALATWHAAGFLAAAEAAALWLWFLRKDRNPFSHAAALAALGVVALVCLSVPFLRAKGAILSPAMIAFGALAVAGVWHSTPRKARAIALVSLIGLALAGRWLAHTLGTTSDFDHVLGLIAAKLRFRGELPLDPSLLSFDVRMMWQGPFATLERAAARREFGPSFLALLVLLVAGVVRFVRGRDGDRQQVLSLLLTLLTVGAWMVARMSAALALLLPPLTALWFARKSAKRASVGRRGLLPFAGAGFLMIQVFTCFHWAQHLELDWHWPVRRDRDRAMVEAIENHVPPGEAVVADFMSSTVILAHTGRPIVVQPKWETASARKKVQRLIRGLYELTPSEFAQQMVEEWQAEYLLLDRHTLQWLRSSRYLAELDLQTGQLPQGSSLAGLLAPLAAGSAAPQFELLWSDEPVAAFPTGESLDWYRLYRVLPHDSED